MENHGSPALSLVEILELLQRRRKMLIICLAVAVFPMMLYNYFATPIYQASAQVVFENFNRDPMMQFTFAGMPQGNNFIANRIEEMKTKAFARLVYAKLPEETKTLFRPPHTIPANFNRDEFYAGTVRKNLLVEPVKTTDVVRISFSAENPELARTVANTAAEVLRQSNLQVRRQEFTSVKEFIDEQMQVVKSRLQRAEDDLRTFKASEHITSLPDESKEVLQRITQAEVLFNQVQNERAAKQKRLTVIRGKLNEQKLDLANSITQVSSPLTMKIKERLVELEVKYAGLQAQNYAPDHPMMKGLKSEIEQFRQNLVRATVEILQEQKLKGVIDPLSQLQKSLEESIALEVELQSLQVQEQYLRKTLEGYADYLKKLPDKEVQLVRLMRDQEVNGKIYLRLLEEREQARIKEAAEIGNIRVMEPAEKPLLPSRPRTVLNLAIGLFTGLVLGLFVVFVLEYSKETFRKPEQVEQLLKLPVLTSVPKFKSGFAFWGNGGRRRQGLLHDDATPPFVRDAFTYLWSSLPLAAVKEPRVVMVTSAGAGEGKSTISSNLAIIAGRHGKRTILVDGDLRQPVLAEMFGLSPVAGLSDLLLMSGSSSQNGNAGSFNTFTTESDWNTETSPARMMEQVTAIVKKFLQEAGVPHVRVLTAGEATISPATLWASPFIGEIITALRQEADLIVIDTPPVIGMPDAGFVARQADGILLCVEAGKTDRTLLQRAPRLLELSKEKIWGVILNKVDPAAIYGSYKHYKYYVKHYHRPRTRQKA